MLQKKEARKDQRKAKEDTKELMETRKEQDKGLKMVDCKISTNYPIPFLAYGLVTNSISLGGAKGFQSCIKDCL